MWWRDQNCPPCWLKSLFYLHHPTSCKPMSLYGFAPCVNICHQCLSLSPVRQDLRNSQARNAAGGLEAFHQPLPAEECPVTGTSWASSAAVRASPGRHQSHGGQRGQAQTVKHEHTRAHTPEKPWDRRRLVRRNDLFTQISFSLQNKCVFHIKLMSLYIIGDEDYWCLKTHTGLLYYFNTVHIGFALWQVDSNTLDILYISLPKYIVHNSTLLS